MIDELAFDVPKFDVESIKNFKTAMRPDDNVIVTEKLHGSQGRFFFREGKMYAGSRNLWKGETSPCVWRKVLRDQPWIEKFCRENEGWILYGEVIPTQKGYRYGVPEGVAEFFVFDIRDEKGEYLPKITTMKLGGLKRVPVLYSGPYSGMRPGLESGASHVPGATIDKEGIVITVTDPLRWERNLGRVQLKQVSNAFLEKTADDEQEHHCAHEVHRLLFRSS